MSEPVELTGFVVGDVLGAGGFAVVWSAVDANGAARALKVARAADDLSRLRFAHEQVALATVGPPHVPALYGAASLTDGRPYLVLEKIEGGSLSEWIAEPAQGRAWAGVADEILAALAAAHARGVVHGDLKPDNVLLTASGARLIDFGLARIAGVGAARTGVTAGTVGYAAPEVLAGQPADARADVYSFGALLYEMLARRPPFAGDRAVVERGHAAQRPPRPGRFAAVPFVVEELVLACLAKRPADRPADAGVVRAELARRLAEVPEATPAVATASVVRPSDAGVPETVAIVVAEGAGIASTVAKTVRARGGFVVSQRAGRHVALFSGAESHNPASVARGVAEELVGRGARVALHVARMLLRRRGPGSVTATGVEVERPELWLPSIWRGVYTTEAFAASEEVEENPTLLGRGAALATALASLNAVRAGEGPALLTVLGERGRGKSRFLRELGRAVRDDVVVTTAEAGGLLGLGGVAESAQALRRLCKDGPRMVLLDDAERASFDTLDAVELATLGGAPVALLVVVAASPALLVTRRGWGRRAQRHDVITLDALELDDAASLAGELLAPAEYPPADALREIARWSAGVPGDLVGLVRRLKRDGAVRPRGHGEGFFLATAVLARLPASAPGEWLAARELDGLAPDLAAFARLIAPLAAPFSRAEVAAILAHFGADLGAALDPDVGLDELSAHGILSSAEGELVFASRVLHEALAALVDPERRREVHAAALAFWRTRAGERARDRVARHAAGAGLTAEAARAQLELAEEARLAQRLYEADQRYGEAFAAADIEPPVRARALLGRGKVLYRLDRSDEALSALDEARALGVELGDAALAAEAGLESATVLDWLERFTASAERVEEVRPLVLRAGSVALRDRLLLADGRSAWRQQRLPATFDFLGRAARAGDAETRTIAGLLLGPALVVAGALDDAELCLARVLDECHESGDRIHEGAAFANRMVLWMARGDTARAADDLRRAIELAREVGHSRSEQFATYNLAEILFFSARDAEALPLARRARWLQERVVGDAVPEDALLLARLHLASGRTTARDDAEAELRWIERNTDGRKWSPTTAALIHAVALATRGGSIEEWTTLHHQTLELPREVQLEARMWHALAGDAESRVVARALVAELPLFARRMSML